MKSLLEQFDNNLANLAWSLWNELGVAGINRYHMNCLISLEELIILTSVIAEFDPRLRDEALDWCSRYHHHVSISRLKSLITALGGSVYTPYSLFAETLNSITRSNWPVFAEVKALIFKPSKKSKLPPLNSSALLNLRLRAAFGVGARADLLTFFLTQNKITFTSSDTVEIGYSKRSLADLLDNFTESGVFAATTIRNQRVFELVKRNEFKRAFGPLPRIIPPWRRIIEFAIPLRETLKQSAKASIATNVVKVRNVLAGMENLLLSLNLHPPSIEGDLKEYWDSFSNWLLRTTNAFAQGNFTEDFELETDYEKTIFFLMQYLYALDDCLDGLEEIINRSTDDPTRHSKVFKEAYQLFFCYINELERSLNEFLKFPFHELMDDKISVIAYNYSQKQLQTLLSFIHELPPVTQITQAHQTLKRYVTILPVLNTLHQLIYEFKDQLKKIHYSKTNVNLLTLSSELYKRHPVIDLFSSLD